MGDMLTLKKSKNGHCNNLESDRAIGDYWERQFCIMAADYGKSFTPLQIDKKNSVQIFNKIKGKWNNFTAPDIAIWTAPGEHHEIKHKNSFHTDRYGALFGLEVYRFNALLWFAQETAQHVMYTIHNHDLSGGRNGKENNIAHWITANILHLDNKWVFRKKTNSYVNGQAKEVLYYAWPIDLWVSLETFWRLT